MPNGPIIRIRRAPLCALPPDTRAEADRLFNGLTAGGVVELAMQEVFWGACFGSFTDRYGVRWRVNCGATG